MKFKVTLVLWMATTAFLYFATHFTQQFQALLPSKAAKEFVADVDGWFHLPFKGQHTSDPNQKP
jgi:hypothetical protein